MTGKHRFMKFRSKNIIKQKTSAFLSELILCFSLILLFVLVRFSSEHLFSEDGLIEYISVLFWLIGFLICLRYLFRKKKKYRLITTVFCLICLFSLGEEISWGQRILDIKTPEYIAKHSRQSEINFHNLYILSGGSTWKRFFETGELSIYQIVDLQNIFRLGFVFFFLVLPILCINKKIYDFVMRIGYYRPTLFFLLNIWIVMIFSALICTNASHHMHHQLQEVREMCYALFIAIYLHRLSRTDEAFRLENQ